MLAPLWLMAPGIDRARRMMLLVAAAFVLIQVAAVYLTYYRVGYAAQGRYAFPVIGPIFALVWIGGVSWLPARWARVSSATLLAAALWLNVHAWTHVVLPGFAR